MKNFYVKLLLLISLLLSACSSIDVQHYRQEQPKLELKRYLNGDLRLGDVHRSIWRGGQAL